MFKYSSVAVPPQPEAVPDTVPSDLIVQAELHQAQPRRGFKTRLLGTKMWITLS